MNEEITLSKIQPIPNDITFTINNQEMLKLCEDGRILVQGRLAATDLEVVEGLREMLTTWRKNGQIETR